MRQQFTMRGDLAHHGKPLVLTQNSEASMVIKSVKKFDGKQALIAALQIMALGEKARALC